LASRADKESTGGKKVPNLATDSVFDSGWTQASAWRTLDFREQTPLTLQKTDLLDEVPVMSATVLGLDMLLQESCVDLRRVSELILSDVGATIQILRLIGKEYDNAVERPSRMGECIASLEVGAWFGAISAQTFVDDREHSATTAVWRHSRLIAQYAQLVAESTEDVSPDDAYLVGLLHGIGTIPAALGWPFCGRDDQGQGALLAMEESLPLFVLAALRGTSDSSTSSVWRFILTAAHKLVCTRVDYDPSTFWGVRSMAVGLR
jgi:hypothetical protein